MKNPIILSPMKAAEALAKALKKPVLYVSWDPGEDLVELDKAAPWLSDFAPYSYDGCAIVVCDSVKEMNNLYSQTIGDDGPTHLNNYNGRARVYAMTIDENGLGMNENT